MENKDELIETENLLLALADKTRLRILNLLRNDEISVNLFSEALMISQPKISRHLSYLRNAEVVTTCREGKWVYYRINSLNPFGSQMLIETLNWLASQESMQIDYKRLIRLSGKQIETPETASKTTYPAYNRNEEIETYLL